MFKSFISLNKVSYLLANGDELFANVTCAFNKGGKYAIIGNNGCGKTTLLRLICNDLQPTHGTIIRQGALSMLPQNIFDCHGSIADVLNIQEKLAALNKIEDGCCLPELFDIIGNDWDIKTRTQEILFSLGVNQALLSDYAHLSGGEKEKVLLARIFLSQADFLLLDEPTNNLDTNGREAFYQLIEKTDKGVILISHDRELLYRVATILELTANGVARYSGNYDFYQSQKQIEKEKLLRQQIDATKEINRLAEVKTKLLEKDAKQQKRGQKMLQNKHWPKMMANTMNDAAAQTLNQKKNTLNEKLREQEAARYTSGLALKEETIKIPLPGRPFLKDKLVEIKNLNFDYGEKMLFQDFNLLLSGSDRLQIKGSNGCGKTTLLQIILGNLKPSKGCAKLNGRAVYLAQRNNILNTEKSLLDNFLSFNPRAKSNDAYKILANFGFRNTEVEKKAGVLSGGEQLKATLAMILGTDEQPDLVILDEPTNNLDINSTLVLEEALRQYQGAIIVISHDALFVKHINLNRILELP